MNNPQTHCPNCLAAPKPSPPDRCHICERPNDGAEPRIFVGMRWSLATALVKGDRFMWDGEVWIVKTLNIQVQPRFPPEWSLDAVSEARDYRPLFMTVRPQMHLMHDGKPPKLESPPMATRTANEPTNAHKLNYLQAQNKLITEHMAASHEMHKTAFQAIETEFREFRDAVVGCLKIVQSNQDAFYKTMEQYRVQVVISTELLSTQTVQMGLIMTFLGIEGRDAMKKGGELVVKMMQRAGVPEDEIEERSKIRAELLDGLTVTPEGEEMERH